MKARHDPKAAAILQNLEMASVECKGASKRKAVADSDSQEPDLSSRSKLHEVYEQVLNRRLEPGDMVYQFREEPGGVVAELSLPSLPGPCGAQTWVSGLRQNRRAARVHVADLALRSLRADNELAMITGESTSGSSPRERGPSRPSSPAPERAVGPLTGSDAKTDLVVFCQWSCGRSMGKQDIAYSVSRRDGEYIATARLDCFAGEEFSGPPRPERRQAEQAAAAEALRAHQRELGVMAKAAPKRRRLQGEVAARDPGPSAKHRLHEACARLLGREPQGGDVVYEVDLTNEGPAASLRLPCLPGALGGRSWSSGPCGSRTGARERAAGMALQALLEDPEYRPLSSA